MQVTLRLFPPRSLPRLVNESTQIARQMARLVLLSRLGLREGQTLMERYQSLDRLSNEDLARRGLTRDTIAKAALGDSARPR